MAKEPEITEAIADTDGSLSFHFNEDLLIPEMFKGFLRRRLNDLEMIKVDRDIGKLEMVVNSDDQPLSNLQYEVFLKEFTPRSMALYIKFVNPLSVSAHNKRDEFVFTILDSSLFVSANGLVEIPEANRKIKVSFPRQFPSAEAKQMFEDTMGAASSSTTSMVIIILVLSVVLKGLRDKLLFMFLNLQLVMTITVYGVLFPSNVETFIGYIRAIVDAEYIKADTIIGIAAPGETVDTLIMKREKPELEGNLQSSGVKS